jgi:hypothetical protein
MELDVDGINQVIPKKDNDVLRFTFEVMFHVDKRLCTLCSLITFQ